MSGNESKRSGGSPGDAPACGDSVQDQRALTEDGQRWNAFMNTPIQNGGSWARAVVPLRVVPCASCDNVGAPTRLVDPRTARVVEWSVLGDARDFAFICDGCASALDGYDRLTWIDSRVKTARELVAGQGWQDSGEISWLLGTVEQFAELLRVHYAGGE